MGVASLRGQQVIGGHIFVLGKRTKRVASVAGHDDRELEEIAREYRKFKEQNHPWVAEMRGEWRWCENPSCLNAFYAKQDRIRTRKALFCSYQCGRMGFQVWSDGLDDHCQWFRNLKLEKAAEWLVGITISQDDASLRILQALLRRKTEKRRVQSVLSELMRPRWSIEQDMVRQFLQTAEGKPLRQLIEQGKGDGVPRALLELNPTPRPRQPLSRELSLPRPRRGRPPRSHRRGDLYQ